MLPTELFSKVELSETTRRPLVELPREIEVLVQNNVTLYDARPNDAFADGVLRLTTHRLIWVDRQFRNPISLLHENLSHVEPQSAIGWHRKYFIALMFPGADSMRVLFDGAQSRDRVLAAYTKALKQALWKKEVVVRKEFSSQNAGISGILRNNEKKLREDSAHVSSAFGDLDELVSKAEQLVKIANRFKAKLKKQQQGGSEGPSVGSNQEEDQLSSMMFELGISSPITKHSAGSLYHEELARQIAGFLPDLVVRSGGMMSLPDVYCIVNRARGTQLVSPEDLYRAVMLLGPLQLPLRYREFPSGVRVVELVGHSDAVTSDGLLALAKRLGHLSSQAVSKQMGISVTLAQQELLNAESEGLLCRDESLAGLLFYENQFWTAANNAAQ